MADAVGVTPARMDAIELLSVQGVTASLDEGVKVTTRDGREFQLANEFATKNIARFSPYDDAAYDETIADWQLPISGLIQKITDPVIQPGAAVNCVAWSGDNKYLAVATQGSAVNGVLMFKRTGDTIATLAFTPVTANEAVSKVAWTADAQFVAFTGSGLFSPYIYVYKRTGDTFAKIADPASIPSAACATLAWSPDGTYLAVALPVSPFMAIYKRSGSVLTRLPDPVAFTGSFWTLAWSEDGTYLAGSNGIVVQIYKRSGDTFTKLTSPANIHASAGSRDVAWSPDGQYLSFAIDLTPFVVTYKRTGDSFAKLPNPSSLPTGICYSVDWHPSGRALALGMDGSPGLCVYSRSGDTFTKLASPAVTHTRYNGIAFSPDGRYLAAGSEIVTRLQVYKSSEAVYGGTPVRTTPTP